MPYSNESYNLRIELDTKNCELSAGEIAKMENDLETLRRLVDAFPVSSLYITVVYHARSKDYHVKTSLALPGRTIFTGERDVLVHPAFDRCIRKLVCRVEGYKASMHGDPELAKQKTRTHQTLLPTGNLSVEQLTAAARDSDYLAFRETLDVFEEPLSKRIGRWIQRYPAIESQLGNSVQISDIVEEVFLNAFEQFLDRPEEVPPGDWLEKLIDPSVQALIQSPDEEFANISFARSLRETARATEARATEARDR
jgi:hypothetical protein